MDSAEFSLFRKKLKKTQKELAQLLGTSLKAIHSYEQGWRTIPPHVERQLFYLVLKKRGLLDHQKNCWTIKKCPPETRKACPSWEFQSGDMCWFTCGTLCANEVQGKWAQKMLICRSCEVLAPLLDAIKSD